MTLTSTYKIFNSTICDVNQKSDLGFANSKSRLRMVTLYQVAAAQNGIVVGTGNKVEDFGVGFYTKYGDGGVDIAPIADLMKSEVKSLSRVLVLIKELLKHLLVMDFGMMIELMRLSLDYHMMN